MNEIVPLHGADSDLIELFNRFEDWRPGMGHEFDRAFVKACDRLELNPLIGPPWRGSFRRLLMVHWSLGIFYEVAGNRVFIHGIMDLRRSPGEIARRLGVR